MRHVSQVDRGADGCGYLGNGECHAGYVGRMWLEEGLIPHMMSSAGFSVKAMLG